MAQGMNAPLYTVEILRLAASLPEPRQLERVDGSSSQRSPTCGSTVATEVQLKDGRVVAVSQTVSACAFGQASASLVAHQAAGHDREEVKAALEELEAWLSGESGAPAGWPGYEALAPARSRTGRHGAILLPLHALLAAMDAAA
jgi:NifU-like protein involved in Fe-S cluster formation